MEKTRVGGGCRPRKYRDTTKMSGRWVGKGGRLIETSVLMSECSQEDIPHPSSKSTHLPFTIIANINTIVITTNLCMQTCLCVCTCACLRSSCLIQPLSLCAPPFHILRANPTPLSPRPTSACPSLPVGPAPLHLPLSACWQCIPPATRDRSWRVHVTIFPLFANHALGHGAKSSSGAAPSHTFFCFSLFVSWVSIPCLCFGVFFPELRFLDFVCSWVLFS